MNDNFMAEERGYDIKYLQNRLNDRDKVHLVLINCVLPETGLHILECAKGNYNYLKQKQEKLF